MHQEMEFDVLMTDADTPTVGVSRELERLRARSDDVPTEPGTEWDPKSLDVGDGGSMIVPIKEALEDIWGELALEIVIDGDVRETYTFLNGSPMELWPDYYDEPVGVRYSYQFMEYLEDCDSLRFVEWEDVGVPGDAEVLYP